MPPVDPLKAIRAAPALMPPVDPLKALRNAPTALPPVEAIDKFGGVVTLPRVEAIDKFGGVVTLPPYSPGNVPAPRAAPRPWPPPSAKHKPYPHPHLFFVPRPDDDDAEGTVASKCVWAGPGPPRTLKQFCGAAIGIDGPLELRKLLECCWNKLAPKLQKCLCEFLQKARESQLFDVGRIKKWPFIDRFSQAERSDPKSAILTFEGRTKRVKSLQGILRDLIKYREPLVIVAQAARLPSGVLTDAGWKPASQLFEVPSCDIRAP